MVTVNVYVSHDSTWLLVDSVLQLTVTVMYLLSLHMWVQLALVSIAELETETVLLWLEFVLKGVYC